MIMMMGMVSRYNDESGIGTLVLKDGDIREFRRNEWVDKEWEPGIGQQVLYKSDHTGTQIRTTTEEEFKQLQNNPVIEEEPLVDEVQKESLLEQQFSNIEEAVEYYQNLGFRMALDIEEEGIRTVSMRFYNQGEFGEALISVNGSNIEISESRNGEPI